MGLRKKKRHKGTHGPKTCKPAPFLYFYLLPGHTHFSIIHYFNNPFCYFDLWVTPDLVSIEPNLILHHTLSTKRSAIIWELQLFGHYLNKTQNNESRASSTQKPVIEKEMHIGKMTTRLSYWVIQRRYVFTYAK